MTNAHGNRAAGLDGAGFGAYSYEATVVADPAPESALDPALLVEMYRRMLRIRGFDDAASRMSEAAEMPGPCHTSTNQEASVVGATLALRDDDYMTGTHRSHGHPIGKGADLKGLMAELLGKRTGICKGKGGSMHLADFSVGSLGESGIVASGVPVAVGASLSAQVRETDQVALTFFGDGASNSGGVHESMNLASIWGLPVVFLCENNGFQVTMDAGRSTAVADVAIRGIGYDMPGTVVDGQDPVAVYHATAAAVARAREGGGPSLVEAKTYRTREHSEGLLVAEYRSSDEIELWKQRDPIPAFAARLTASGVLGEQQLEEVNREVEAELEAAIAFARASEEPPPDDLFADMFASAVGDGA